LGCDIDLDCRSQVTGLLPIILPILSGTGAHMARDQLKLMESAIVLAEELHFSRAARRLHISQPALTKQIAELEQRVGAQLFSREKQVVSLTDAGRAFIESARLCVFHGKRAIQAVQTAARETESVLSIGRSPYIDPFLVSTLLTVRLPLFPDLRLELPSRFSPDLVHEVLAGTLDLAIVTDPPESAALSRVQIAESQFFITMSVEDDLAHRRQLTLDDLSEREWVLFERHVHPALYELILDLAKERNVRPTKIHHFVAAEEALPFITQSSAIAFLRKSEALRLTKSAPSRSPRGIAIRPLQEEALLLKTFVASRADNGSKLASELLRAFVRKLAQFTEVKQLILPMST
jgi:DNA-binding transcriptional LysR family regulator